MQDMCEAVKARCLSKGVLNAEYLFCSFTHRLWERSIASPYPKTVLTGCGFGGVQTYLGSSQVLTVRAPRIISL